MSLWTPKAAMRRTCPIARVQGDAQADGTMSGKCRAEDCMLWRWVIPDTSHPAWAPAVRKVAEETGEKAPFAKASRVVANNPEAHGLKLERGWCGLGGRPE